MTPRRTVSRSIALTSFCNAVNNSGRYPLFIDPLYMFAIAKKELSLQQPPHRRTPGLTRHNTAYSYPKPAYPTSDLNKLNPSKAMQQQSSNRSIPQLTTLSNHPRMLTILAEAVLIQGFVRNHYCLHFMSLHHPPFLLCYASKTRKTRHGNGRWE